MIKKEIMGHWYKCEACDKKIPIPDYVFTNLHDADIIQESCDFCDRPQLFRLSDAKKLCTKKEALSYFKIEQQIKEGKLRSEHYWEK